MSIGGIVGSLAGPATALAALAGAGTMTGPEAMAVESMSIAGVDENGDFIIAERAFQWWPESFADNLAGGWSKKPVPGASHAMVNWSSNQGRTFSFSVMLTRQLIEPEDLQQNTVGFEVGALLGTTQDPYDSRNRQYNVDVAAGIAYLRSYMYPRYGSAGLSSPTDVKPPATVILNIPNMQLNEDGSDTVWCKMFGCDVSYMKSFPNGRPRIAQVTLTFEQIIQGPEGVRFKSFRDIYNRGSVNGRGAGSSYRNPRGITTPIKKGGNP